MPRVVLLGPLDCVVFAGEDQLGVREFGQDAVGRIQQHIDTLTRLKSADEENPHLAVVACPRVLTGQIAGAEVNHKFGGVVAADFVAEFRPDRGADGVDERRPFAGRRL